MTGDLPLIAANDLAVLDAAQNATIVIRIGISSATGTATAKGEDGVAHPIAGAVPAPTEGETTVHGHPPPTTERIESTIETEREIATVIASGSGIGIGILETGIVNARGRESRLPLLTNIKPFHLMS